MDSLLADIRSCTLCKAQLPYFPKPVVQAAADSKIAVIGQAPGQKVQNSGVPWDDQSGNELRRWLGVDDNLFYDPQLFALVPMGFCYPGKGRAGDLPPRPECAPLWHQKLFANMPELKLTVLIGQYAQAYYLGKTKARSLTDTVYRFEMYMPTYFPLVHPSPRNKIWHKRNPWFMTDIIPVLQRTVNTIIGM